MLAQICCRIISYCARVFYIAYGTTDLEIRFYVASTEGIVVKTESIIRH